MISKTPLNPEFPKALESVEDVCWDTKLVVLEHYENIRVCGQWVRWVKGKVISVDSYGGVKEIGRLIHDQHIRFAKVEAPVEQEDVMSVKKTRKYKVDNGSASEV